MLVTNLVRFRQGVPQRQKSVVKRPARDEDKMRTHSRWRQSQDDLGFSTQTATDKDTH